MDGLPLRRFGGGGGLLTEEFCEWELEEDEEKPTDVAAGGRGGAAGAACCCGGLGGDRPAAAAWLNEKSSTLKPPRELSASAASRFGGTDVSLSYFSHSAWSFSWALGPSATDTPFLALPRGRPRAPLLRYLEHGMRLLAHPIVKVLAVLATTTPWRNDAAMQLSTEQRRATNYLDAKSLLVLV